MSSRWSLKARSRSASCGTGWGSNEARAPARFRLGIGVSQFVPRTGLQLGPNSGARLKVRDELIFARRLPASPRAGADHGGTGPWACWIAGRLYSTRFRASGAFSQLRIGELQPVSSTGLGKALISITARKRGRVSSREKGICGTQISQAAWVARMRATRRRGCAFDLERRGPDRCVAAPDRDVTGRSSPASLVPSARSTERERCRR